jgi:hypothetical protein
MVQPTGVNSLLALVGALPAPAANATEDGDASQVFSQLLNDSGKQTSDQQQQQFRGNLVPAATLNVLSAQELPTTANDAARQLLGARDEVVSAEDAPALIARVEKILSISRSAESAEVLKQLKAQLLAISRGGETKTVGELVQSANAVADSKLSVVALTALLAPRKPQQPTAETTQEEEELGGAALLQSVPAAIFHPHAADDGATQATPEPAQAKRHDLLETVSVITPLAAVTVSPALAQALNNDAFKARADLDTLIPPLTAPKPEVQALPEITLPRLKDESAVTNTTSPATFEQLLGNAANTNDVSVSNNVVNDIAPPTGQAGQVNAGNTVQPPTVSQTLQLVSTPGYINQKPVTEQVHVAVRKAASDGLENITVQLDPIDLGRVEVNIQTNRDGLTSISFIVDKPETFDHLSRDARSLERALQESGVKTDTGSMQFNLRQQPQLHSDAGGSGHRGQQPNADDTSTLSGERNSAAITNELTRHYIINVRDGVDISA